ncbi:MAG TPA: OadG family transporter subunit [Anaerolineales bacterium]|nr:OadG family transporter subunit [Anaerolineales bacterium]
MNDMGIALQITALGMGLVFGAILLLWWMMNLLTSITADKKAVSASTESSGEAVPASAIDSDLNARAAAVAVAIALAEEQASNMHSLSEPPTTIVSAWQLGMRTRQMYQKGVSVRRRVR